MAFSEPSADASDAAGGNVDRPADRSPSHDVTDPIRARLAAGDGHRAAVMLIDAIAGGTLAGNVSLAEWFADLGEPARAALVSAFAHFPCFACRNGTEACEACHESGFVAVARPCPACVGFGVKRCDFCNGSGLATYSLMPIELQPNVLVARAARARKYLQRLAVSRVGTTTARLEAQHVQDANKLLGVLENAVVAARELAAAGYLSPEATAQFAASCDRVAAAGVGHLRGSLRWLASHHRELSGATGALADAENAAAMAEFYEDLAQSPSFDGTGLAHPFLHIAPPASDDDAAGPT